MPLRPGSLAKSSLAANLLEMHSAGSVFPPWSISPPYPCGLVPAASEMFMPSLRLMRFTHCFGSAPGCVWLPTWLRARVLASLAMMTRTARAIAKAIAIASGPIATRRAAITGHTAVPASAMSALPRPLSAS